jgi:hypothetical protein
MENRGGRALPALVGWTFLSLLAVLTVWTGVFRTLVSIGSAWDCVDNGAAIKRFHHRCVERSCWTHLDITPKERHKWNQVGLWIYYTPFLILFIASVYTFGMPFGGIIIHGFFPIRSFIGISLIHAGCFWWGELKGEKWIEEGFLKQFFGSNSSSKKANARVDTIYPDTRKSPETFSRRSPDRGFRCLRREGR